MSAVGCFSGGEWGLLRVMEIIMGKCSQKVQK